MMLTCRASLVKSLGLSEPLMGVRNEMLDLRGTYYKPDPDSVLCSYLI